MRRSTLAPFLGVPVLVALLAGCAGQGGTTVAETATPTATPTATATAAPTETPFPTVEPTPVPTTGELTAQDAWNLCYSEHTAEYPLTDGEIVAPYVDSDVTWSDAEGAYVVHIATKVRENEELVDGTRSCLVTRDAADPQVTLNPVTE